MNNRLLPFLVFFSGILFAGTNSHGQLGYINTPSAFNFSESTVDFSITRDNPDRKYNLTFSPFSWFDATIFYVDITGKDYGNGFKQSYKDKGFNLKFSLINGHINKPSIAVGFNDFAGTGLYGSEYIVLSDRSGKFDFSLGIGWGEYAGGLRFDNPIRYFDDRFNTRSQETKDRGGNVDLNNYFSGNHAALFGAIAYNKDVSTRWIFELDPTKDNEKIGTRKRDNRINIGYEKLFKNFLFKSSYLGFREFQFQISYRENYQKYKKNSYIRKVNSHQELQEILSRNSIGLMELAENQADLYIKVQQNAYENQYQVNESIYSIIRRSYPNSDSLNISQEHLGMEVVKTFYSLKDEISIRNEKKSNDIEYMKIYEVIEPYPIINNSLSPKFRTMLASREGFLFGGVMLENDLEIIFKKNLIFLSNLKYTIFDNFDELYIPPVDTYPNQVRSDIKQYLNNFQNRLVIGRAEINFFKSLNQSHFFRFSAGIFEDMFGGIGVDYLFNPQGSIFSAGFESYKVKKRSYKMGFNFQDYKNTLSRASIQVIEPYTDIYLRLSYGEYLATDVGYTFEIGRRFDNGVEFTGFFTRTDVSKNDFGEGSFDKGIRFKIPISLFSFGKKPGLSSFEWRPLTKDPGSLLIKSIDIRDRLNRFRVY